jgi:hypothetical protein
VPFSIDPARRMRLLNGWDDLDLTAQYKDRIAAFAAKDRAERPWAVPAAILTARPRGMRGPSLFLWMPAGVHPRLDRGRA